MHYLLVVASIKFNSIFHVLIRCNMYESIFIYTYESIYCVIIIGYIV